MSKDKLKELKIELNFQIAYLIIKKIMIVQIKKYKNSKYLKK